MYFYELDDGRVRLTKKRGSQKDFQISIDDKNIEKLNLDHLRNIIGIVSQEPVSKCYQPGNERVELQIENNIRLGAPDIDDNEMEYYCKLATAHDFIEQLPKVSFVLDYAIYLFSRDIRQ